MHQIAAATTTTTDDSSIDTIATIATKRGSILTQPTDEEISNSQMIHFARHYKLPESYPELYKYSIEDGDDFWLKLLLFSNIPHSGSPSPVRREGGITTVPEWFPCLQLNFCESIFYGRDPDKVAIIHGGEGSSKTTKKITFGQLERDVIAMATSFKTAGIGSGDVVAALASNCPGVVIGALATAAVGATFTTISPDFGVMAIIERLRQSKPSLLFAAKTVFYNGRHHPQQEKLLSVLKEVPIPLLIEPLGSIESSEQSKLVFTDWNEFISTSSTSTSTVPFSYERFPFNHALYILYSSGTTGPPKCLVHSAGGTLLQHIKEHRLHGNMAPNAADSVLLQYTTIGWMMWHWQLSSLALGATICLWDGSPFKPDPLSLLAFCAEEKVTHLGVGAKYIQHLEATTATATATATLTKSSDLSSLRFPFLTTVYSTGSPLSAQSFQFINAIMPKVRIYSITGGTDIISLFAGGSPLLPVRAGEISSPCLGMAIALLVGDGDGGDGGDGCNNNNNTCTNTSNNTNNNSNNNTCINNNNNQKNNNNQNNRIIHPFVGVGEGDLVCLKPFPSMPVLVGVMDDSGQMHQAYQKTYFPFSPQLPIWYHGDFCEFTSASDGGIIMRGRSDGTLNPGGVRFGSSEIYELIADVPFIQDSLVVGVKNGDDEDVILFLKLSDDFNGDDRNDVDLNSKDIITTTTTTTTTKTRTTNTAIQEIMDNVKKVIKESLSARHLPKKIFITPTIPYTKNGKKVEVAIKRLLSSRRWDYPLPETVVSASDVEFYRSILKDGLL